MPIDGISWFLSLLRRFWLLVGVKLQQEAQGVFARVSFDEAEGRLAALVLLVGVGASLEQQLDRAMWAAAPN